MFLTFFPAIRRLGYTMKQTASALVKHGSSERISMCSTLSQHKQRNFTPFESETMRDISKNLDRYVERLEVVVKLPPY